MVLVKKQIQAGTFLCLPTTMGSTFVPPPVFSSNGDDSDRPGKRQRLYHDSNDANGQPMDVDDVDMYNFDVAAAKPKHIDKDPLSFIPGMYRLLDLISEQSSGGTVDKIIIDQHSLKSFINDARPGAYHSLTKVDFKSLDQLSLKPLGVYGPKHEIANFLHNLGVLDHEKLLQIVKSDAHVGLRSGLYLVKPISVSSPTHVIYWPEETTWNDNCASSVRRNRITFMRYLSKVADQTVCLIPPEHARTFVWKEDADDIIVVDIEDGSFDRMYTFEVSKTNEQEENVQMRTGFEMPGKAIHPPPTDLPADFTLDPSVFLPRLLVGETNQAFLSVSYTPPSENTRNIVDEKHNSLKLKSLVEAAGLVSISANVDEETVEILVEHGLQKHYGQPVIAWRERKATLLKDVDIWREDELRNVKEANAKQEQSIHAMTERAILGKILDKFPTLDKEKILPALGSEEEEAILKGRLETFVTQHSAYKVALDAIKVEKITHKHFLSLKRRIVGTKAFLDSEQGLSEDGRKAFIDVMVSHVSLEESLATSSGFMGMLKNAFSPAKPLKVQQLTELADAVPDGQFAASLDEYRQVEPRLNDFIDEAMELILTHARDMITKRSKAPAAKAMQTLQDVCKVQVIRDIASRRERSERESRLHLLEEIEKANKDQVCRLHIDSVGKKNGYSQNTVYIVNASTTQRTDPMLTYAIHLLHISQEDQQRLQMDANFIPSPSINERLNQTFSLPVGHRVLYLHSLDKEKFLLVLDDCRDGVSIYLERGSSLQNAVTYQRPKKLIRYDKIEKDLVFAYDERKRMLLICAQNMLQLHLFCFDETFSGLQGWGSAVNLLAWYQPGVSIAHACFVLGNEEVFLLDSSGQGRVFSLVAQQFRPATLSLNKVPLFVYPSPDGACLFLVDTQDDETLVHAYHWSAFGSNEPITHVLPFTPTGPLLLTSITSRNSIHLVGLDLQRQVARSHLFNITTKVTEFQFKEHNSRKTVTQDHRTAHNSLIDCHADVWTRFPVVAAIQHHITGVSKAQKRLIFATDRDFENYVPHFNSLVQDFEQTTRKPTENCLKDIQISSTPLRDIHKELKQLSVSQFHLGEWIVGFLCLIPIHIAITRENRFLPLKDGVVSPEWEKSLLGAEVGKIVDSVSLGWYESIFQSYMAHKPVKVVSSMGEQSVGKSYSLNHFVDSSFAGSAMRTTEGVWLSCTPTDDALIVALDFEGVHSIERSAQEDTLLVLFNTALSNLVLFRNNFALSRDITGLFQSFQSSSTVLDPAANPSLFQSTLVIIIKDVVESDKDEIVKEFSLKFQKIVQEEQDANFISRLHAGRLNIVPWPVIESKNFYTLFHILRKRLDQQKITHPAAGEFLLTLKTLMAKLKANDWGSISQTLVAHRAQRLTALLPTALMYGLAEIEPQEESLKNFDTDEIITLDDEWEHPSVFLWLEAASTGNGRDLAMLKLCQSWPNYFKRDDLPEAEWLDGLTKYLQGLVNARVRLVRAWIQSNLSRFTASHASISDLWREFEKLQVDLKAGVELCRMKCSTCHLLCVGNRRHDADAPHDCKTSHMCPRTCDYSQDHQDEEKQCGYPAGHTGGHICTVDTHLCGKPCRLKDKRGCLGECTQVVGHDGDHNCPSKVHSCGQPCSLQGVTLPGGKKYSCSDTCMISSEQEHEDHVCDSRMCPVTCEQCNRLCSDADHLHALDRSSIHLCGQEHSCSALCAAPGSCEIETAPQSIKATFTGQHETFEYTKYSQVAKRLKCAIVIPPGERTHKGHHVHTTDPTRVHFCETRCEFCGYYCTLPLGHPQQLHETSHGSMSKSQWVVDGPAGTMMEVDGHKFGSEDDGAPMMCNLVCTNLGRHPHMDYCRTQDGPCGGPDTQHVARNIRFNPNPDREKDWISHSLFWRRTGFKDPYSRDDQANFAKCDAMCAGPEHKGNVNTPAQPSYCTLPLFHPPETTNRNVQLGYRSHDGHVFPCKNPAVLQQAFHVIFVVDRSGSMSYSDRRPLTNTPVSAQIQRSHNDRLGAVYSALHSFWTSRHAAVTGQGAAVASRRDAYSVILFDHTISTVITNDFASDPQTLLNAVLRYGAAGGTNFELALGAASTVMRQHWSSERTPVVVFLSDGECSLPDLKVQDLCRTAVSLGKPLSLHTVSFGSSNEVLRRMARIALDIQKNTPVDPNAPANSRIDSSFSEALDSVQLASTFMSIAESLRKPRGALMHT